MLRLNAQEARDALLPALRLPSASLAVRVFEVFAARSAYARSLIAELSDLVVAPPLMKTCSTRCAAHELLVVPTFVVQFIQRKFQTFLIQIAPRLRNAALAWLRAGLASSGATPERQAIQGPMDPLSPVDAFLRHCLSLSAKCRPQEERRGSPERNPSFRGSA